MTAREAENQPSGHDQAGGYERYIGRWSRAIAPRFVAWLEAAPDARWLDLGSGTGALSQAICEGARPAEVVGVEPSPAFIDAACARLRDPRVSFRRGSSSSVPYPDARADVAVCGFVLNFVEDRVLAMNELLRCLKPGGLVAASLWDYAGHAQFMRHFWNAALHLDHRSVEFDEARRTPICRPKALREFFLSLGLCEVQMTAIDIITEFRNFDDYWLPLLHGAGPAPRYCATLDTEALTKLREHLRLQLPSDDDGTILLVARAWAIKGVAPDHRPLNS